MDLLEHEVLVPALLRVTCLALNGGYLAAYLLARVPDLVGLATHLRYIALFQIYEPVGNRAECERVGGDEVFTDTDANYQGASGSRYDDLIWLVAIYDTQAIGTLKLLHGLLHRIEQANLIIAPFLVNEMRNYLSICLSLENIAGLGQLLAERLVILDDAIVHDGDIATRGMGMGIRDSCLAVCRPARVCYAELTLHL